MKILRTFSCVLLIIVVRETTSLNLYRFISDSSAVCTVSTELYWKMIRWFYGPLQFVDVYILTETSTTLSMNQLSTLFLKEIAERLNVKVSYTVLDTQFEHESISYSETFSWQGEKFEKRPGEESQLVYRKKRSIDDYPPKTWSKRTDEPEAGIFIIVDSIKIINEYMVGTPRGPFRLPRQIFVIAITGADEYKFDETSKHLLEKLWNDYAIGNVIIITPCDGDAQVIRTYFPYTRMNATYWGEHQSFNLTEIDFTKASLFRKFTDLQGFPLRVTIFRRSPTALKSHEFPAAFRNSYLMKDSWRADEYSGVDGIMLANAAKTLNFTALNIPQIGIDFGYKVANGTFVGSIGSVLHSKVYASFNGRFLTNYDTNDIDYMFPYYFDQLCVIAPKALKIPGWMAIFKCFSISVWLFLLVVNCLCGLFWFMLKRSNINYLTRRKKACETRKSSNRFRNVIIEMWIIMLSGPATNLPTLGKERIFMGACLISSLIFSGTFQGTLVTSFSTDQYYKDINTLEELDESGLEIGTSSGSLKNLFGEKSLGTPIIRSLASKYKMISTTTPIIARAAYQRDICAIERLTDIRVIIAKQYETPDGNALLHVIKECPRSYYMSYIMKRGSPLLPALSNFIRRLFEAGIVKLWYNHVEYTLITYQRYHHDAYKSNEAQAFTMVDMQTAFYILCIGLGCSCIVFMYELYTHKREQSQPFEFVH